MQWPFLLLRYCNQNLPLLVYHSPLSPQLVKLRMLLVNLRVLAQSGKLRVEITAEDKVDNNLSLGLWTSRIRSAISRTSMRRWMLAFLGRLFPDLENLSTLT